MQIQAPILVRIHQCMVVNTKTENLRDVVDALKPLRKNRKTGATTATSGGDSHWGYRWSFDPPSSTFMSLDVCRPPVKLRFFLMKRQRETTCV